MKYLFGLIVSCLALSGCGLMDTKPETTQIAKLGKGTRVVTVDASRRSTYLAKRGGSTIVCAEPPPDVMVSYDNAVRMSLGVGGTVNGAVNNPLHKPLKFVDNLLTRDALGNTLHSALRKDGKPVRLLSELTPETLADITADINASIGYAKRSSMTAQQIQLSDEIRVMRANLYWACINLANSGKAYDEKFFSERQADITNAINEAMAQRLIADNVRAQADLIRAQAELERVRAANGVSSRSALDLSGQLPGSRPNKPFRPEGDIPQGPSASAPSAEVRIAEDAAIVASLNATAALSRGLTDPLRVSRRAQADSLSRKAYAELLTGSLKLAYQGFVDVNQVYPNFQSAFETTTAINNVGKTAGVVDERKRCAVLGEISRKNSTYGMTDREKATFMAKVSACSAGLAK